MNSPAKCKRLIALGVSCVLSLSAAAGQGIEAGIQAYETGQYEKAYNILKANAEQGDSQSQYLLSILYRTGLGVSQDEYDAFHWCKLAAEDGLLEAQYQLGLMYLQGEGVTSSDEKALGWFWIAADRGYPQAREMLDYVLNNDFTYGC